MNAHLEISPCMLSFALDFCSVTLFISQNCHATKGRQSANVSNKTGLPLHWVSFFWDFENASSSVRSLTRTNEIICVRFVANKISSFLDQLEQTPYAELKIESVVGNGHMFCRCAMWMAVGRRGGASKSVRFIDMNSNMFVAPADDARDFSTKSNSV